jgi:hypothetical protein
VVVHLRIIPDVGRSQVITSTTCRRIATTLAWMVLLIGPDALASPEDRAGAIARDLTRLSLDLHDQLEATEANLSSGRLDDRQVADRLKEATEAVEGFAQQIDALPNDIGAALHNKLDAIGWQVENLRQTAETGIATSRLRLPLGTEARNLDGRYLLQFSNVPNDDCDQAYPIIPGEYSGTTVGATVDGQAACGASTETPDVWFEFTAPSSDTWVFEIVQADFDSVLSLHSNVCPGTTSTQRACNDDHNGVHPLIGLYTSSGSTYRVRVSGFNGATGTFTLRVSNSSSIGGSVTVQGQPAVVRVDAYDEDGNRRGYDWSDGEDGSYEITGLIPGTYRVRTDAFDSDSIENQLYDGIGCGVSGDECPLTDGDIVPVPTDATVSSIDFDLRPTASIAGTAVSTETGDPVRSVWISLHDQTGSIASDSTDSSGAYKITNIVPGTYYLLASNMEFQDLGWDNVPCPDGVGEGCTYDDLDPIVITGTEQLNGVDFEVQPLGSISGTVLEYPSLQPNTGHGQVRVYDLYGNFVRNTFYSSYDGTYLVSRLLDGTYLVKADPPSLHYNQLYDGQDCIPEDCTFADATPVTISNLSQVTGIDFAVRRKGRIRGTVDSANGRVENLYVKVHDEEGSVVGGDGTDETGYYEVEGLAAGTYYVVADGNNYQGEVFDNIPCVSCDVTTGTPVTVYSSSATSGINFWLNEYGHITGSVRDATSYQDLYTRVRVYTNAGGYVGSSYSYNGDYDIAGLAAGTYFLTAGAEVGSHLGELYSQHPCWDDESAPGCDPTQGNHVPVANNTTTSGINFTLSRSGSISGSIVDGIDGSSPSASVYAIRSDGNWTGYDYVSGGSYTIEGLAPGTYQLIADAHSHIDEFWLNRPCPGEYPLDCPITGTPVSVGAGSQLSGYSFTLDRYAKITGVVTTASDGQPVAHQSVAAYDPEGNRVDTAFSDLDGVYLLDSLYPGSYFVATWDENVHVIDQLFNGIECFGGPGDGCDPVTGTPVLTWANSAAAGIDFDLQRTGAISGRVVHDPTGAPLSSVRVRAYDAQGSAVRYDTTDAQGMYAIQGLGNGNYYVLTSTSSSSSNNIDELWDDLYCPDAPPHGCDPTKGRPVPVTTDTTTRFVDFQHLDVVHQLHRLIVADVVEPVGRAAGGGVRGVACPSGLGSATWSSTRITPSTMSSM